MVHQFHNLIEWLHYATLDWVNVDYFARFDNPFASLDACLPEGYNSDNSIVYAVLSDLDVVLALESNDNVFTASLPIGERLHLISLTAEGTIFLVWAK